MNTAIETKTPVYAGSEAYAASKKGSDSYSDIFKNMVESQSAKMENVLLIMNSEGDKQTENNLFRHDVMADTGIRRIDTWKQVMNHPNMPHTDFSKKAYGLSVKEVVLHLTFADPYWFSHAFPKEIFDRVVSELEKQSFVKRLHVYLEDVYQCRWEGKRKLTVGFVVSKKKFRKWFQQNQNRFLQKDKNTNLNNQ